MAKLTVTVKEKKTGVEGVFQLPGTTTSKLARKDGTTVFPNRASLTQAARRVADKLGWEAELVAPPAKAAAKKSVKPATKSKKSAVDSTSSCSQSQ